MDGYNWGHGENHRLGGVRLGILHTLHHALTAAQAIADASIGPFSVGLSQQVIGDAPCLPFGTRRVTHKTDVDVGVMLLGADPEMCPPTDAVTHGTQ